MAKNDNLQDFLTDVADAIRAKKGTTAKINPQDFSSEIASIQSGAEPKETKDVNFYDYDGTILYSYTWDEALQLTEMPPLPDRTNEGLTCEGWNWTLEEMQANEGMCDVGAMYITDDGKTRLYLNIENDEYEEDLTVMLGFGAYGEALSLIVYWGDGSEDTFNLKINQDLHPTHKYDTKGKYIVELEVLSGNLYIGQRMSSATYTMIGNTMQSKRMLVRFEAGNNIAVYSQECFAYAPNLKHVLMNTGSVNEMSSNCFMHTGVKHLNLPRVTRLGGIGANYIESVSMPDVVGTMSFMHCYRLQRVILPKNSTLANQCFHTDYCIKTIHVGEVNNLSQYMFYNVRLMRHHPVLSDSITAIGQACFSTCWSLKEIIVPASVTNIAQQAFNNCSSLDYIDFTKLSAVPTLDNANAFTGIPADCEIRVPMALVDEWKAATNWSTYADYIVGY